MKLIIYCSKTGFTQRYAEMIAKETNLEVKNLKEALKLNLLVYDEVIFGGSLFAGTINGYSKIIKKPVKSLIVFAVGMTPMSEDYEKKVAGDNKIEGPFFYFQGGVDYEKLGFLKGTLLRKITKQEDSIDLSKKEYIDRLVNCILRDV